MYTVEQASARHVGGFKQWRTAKCYITQLKNLHVNNLALHERPTTRYHDIWWPKHNVSCGQCINVFCSSTMYDLDARNCLVRPELHVSINPVEGKLQAWTRYSFRCITYYTCTCFLNHAASSPANMHMIWGCWFSVSWRTGQTSVGVHSQDAFQAVGNSLDCVGVDPNLRLLRYILTHKLRSGDYLILLALTPNQNLGTECVQVPNFESISGFGRDWQLFRTCWPTVKVGKEHIMAWVNRTPCRLHSFEQRALCGGEIHTHRKHPRWFQDKNQRVNKSGAWGRVIFDNKTAYPSDKAPCHTLKSLNDPQYVSTNLLLQIILWWLSAMPKKSRHKQAKADANTMIKSNQCQTL